MIQTRPLIKITEADAYNYVLEDVAVVLDHSATTNLCECMTCRYLLTKLRRVLRIPS